MILVDIDGTISPTQVDDAMKLRFDEQGGYETQRAGFVVVIPNYILDFLRGQDSIYMLSTWGSSAALVPEAFGFEAQTLNMEDFTDKRGIQGKFAVVKHFAGKVDAWLDDHITPAQKKYCAENGIIAIKPTPTKGCMTPAQVEQLRAGLAAKG